MANVESKNAVVAKALNACARNADIWGLVKQEFYKQYKGRANATVDGRDSPSGDFEYFEHLYGMTDDSGVDWKPIAEKVRKALIADGYKNPVVRVTQWNNGIVGKTGVKTNSCGTARNASGHKVKVTIKSITDKGIQTFEKIVDVDGLESWMRSAGLGGEYQHVMKQLTAMGVNEVSLPAMSKVMIANGGRGLFDASMVTKNACGTARNAGAENHIGKRFGNVEVEAWDFDGNRHFEFGLGIPFNEPSRTVGKVGSKEYAISKAEESLKRHRQNIADIEKGIAWLKAAK